MFLNDPPWQNKNRVIKRNVSDAPYQKTGKPHNFKNRLEQENKKTKINVTYV